MVMSKSVKSAPYVRTRSVVIVISFVIYFLTNPKIDFKLFQLKY